MRWRSAVLFVACMLASACGGDDGALEGRPAETTSASTTTSTTAAVAPAYVSEVYDDLAVWLCHPDRVDDACDLDLDITRIDRDGTRTVEPVTAATDAPIDCFYVYPTVSDDASPNSDLVPGPAEERVARAQVAPFAPVCRIFAPVYRQITLSALRGDVDGIPDRALAYLDVEDAWRHYLANHNDGRGVILIGHSQGAGHLRELLSRRIENEPSELDLVVSAMLLGTTVRTPVDAEVGAHLDTVAPCRARDDVGCVVSYSSYPVDVPPGDGGFFGGVRDAPGERAVCTNPAALGGGAATLDSIVTANPDRDGEVTTEFVRYRGLAEAECVEEGSFHYLAVGYQEGGGWPSEIGGQLAPSWGLHLIDVNLALGDLVSLAADQGAARGRR